MCTMLLWYALHKAEHNYAGSLYDKILRTKFIANLGLKDSDINPTP